MPNLRDIKKRINSVQSTKQITRTMEMVASAKIRHSFERIQAAQPYATCMNEPLASLAKNTSSNAHPLLSRRDDVKNVIVIVVVSDRGLAGGFNSNVLREFEHVLAAKEAEGAQVGVIACGKKALGYLSYRKITPLLTFTDLSADPTFEEAKEIASYCMAQFTEGDVDEVELIYNHAVNSATQKLITTEILPIDASYLAGEKTDGEAEAPAAPSGSEDKGPQGEYEFEPSSEEVLGQLLPAYVESKVFTALIDSAAGEQGARRKAMMAATDNATEMLDTLNRLYNTVRQSAITTELNEIVGGAAALED